MNNAALRSQLLPQSVSDRTKRMGSPNASRTETSWTVAVCVSKCPTDPTNAAAMPAAVSQ